MVNVGGVWHRGVWERDGKFWMMESMAQGNSINSLKTDLDGWVIVDPPEVRKLTFEDDIETACKAVKFAYKLIGLSVSLCIRDILRGKMWEDNVDIIIGSTCIKTKKSLEDVIKMYKNVYWSADPKEGERIFRKLWEEGRVMQPRLMGGLVVAVDCSSCHWSYDSVEDVLHNKLILRR